MTLEIRLTKNLRTAVMAGHPWLYRTAFERLPSAPAGSHVRISDKHGFLAWGILDPEHSLAVRVMRTDQDLEPDLELIIQRLQVAQDLRRRVVPATVEAYRLVHGESDGLPGWAIDRYGDVLVVRTDGAAAIARLPLLVQAIQRCQLGEVRCLVHRRSRGDSEGASAEVVFGPSPEPRPYREYGWQMDADVLLGQKTGWFIDQRENRKLIFEISRGLRVANLFSYNGGFSLAAALGGAAQVTSVDISKPAIAAAQANFELNGLALSEYNFCAQDAFDWQAEAMVAGHSYDLMIIDPPSFAPNQRSVPNAERAYGRLFRNAARLLAPGGLLAASSCSSHIPMDHFRQIVSDAVRKEGRQLAILHERGAGPDHPVLPAFPEGRYLKFTLGTLR